jgi:hypothetical protein
VVVDLDEAPVLERLGDPVDVAFRDAGVLSDGARLRLPQLQYREGRVDLLVRESEALEQVPERRVVHGE